MAACDAGTITTSDTAPPPPEGGTSGGPGEGSPIQRGVLVVTLAIADADAPLAAAVGLGTPGLAVRLRRLGANETPRISTADAQGKVTFDALLQGTYEVSVERPLTASEAELLPADARDATLFAGGTTVTLVPPSAIAAVELVASRRGSLIVSELFIFYAQVPLVGARGMYAEVYNNSDTTIYLDGMLLFNTWAGMHTGDARCADNSDVRLDPTGIWAYYVFRFPGGGRQFAVAPGEARVIATDAIDHTGIAPGMQDLSRAHFEFIGDAADPNNPFAADMLRLKGGADPAGHRLMNNAMAGLALPIATDTLQLERRVLITPSLQFSVFKIPREAILDATAYVITREHITAGGECDPFTSPSFDAQPSQLSNPDLPMAFARRSLGRTAAGAEILQRTRNSARDFELSIPLRRSLLRR